MTEKNSFLETLQRRHNFRYFKKEAPDKNIIDKILQMSIDHCPIKNDIWHFSVEVYGPEYQEEKNDLCIRTVCDSKVNKLPWEQQKGRYNYYLKNPQDEMFKTDDKKYNNQVIAPYLIVYRKKMWNHFGWERRLFRSDEQMKSYYPGYHGDISLISMGIHAYCISLLANYHNIDSSFCRCFVNPKVHIGPHNKIYDDGHIELTVGLGYEDKDLNNLIDIRKKKLRAEGKPNFDDVIKWQK